MKHFALGIILGSVLTTTILGAGTFYDSTGTPSAPRGSVHQYDYFRQRQQFLDLNAIRRNQETQMQQQRTNPCAK